MYKEFVIAGVVIIAVFYFVFKMSFKWAYERSLEIAEDIVSAEAEEMFTSWHESNPNKMLEAGQFNAMVNRLALNAHVKQGVLYNPDSLFTCDVHAIAFNESCTNVNLLGIEVHYG